MANSVDLDQVLCSSASGPVYNAKAKAYLSQYLGYLWYYLYTSKISKERWQFHVLCLF